jgi:hypothetical protein
MRADDDVAEVETWRPDPLRAAFGQALAALMAALPADSAEVQIAVAEVMEAYTRTAAALRAACGRLH